MSYDKKQLTKPSRHFAGVRAYRILSMKENQAEIQLWPNDTKTEKIPLSDITGIQAGTYIDLIIARQGNCSYSTEFVGLTPPAFIPTNGQNIGI